MSSLNPVATPRSRAAPAANFAPALTVAAIVQRRGRFLVVEEMAHGERVINQPAGHVEAGESLVEAVVRETLEETAWCFRPEAVAGIYLWRRPGTQQRFLRVAFSGVVTARRPWRALDDGIIAARWLTRSALLARRSELRSPLVLQGIDDYLAGSLQPLETVTGRDMAGLLERALLL